jgi:multidrug transporter EmrE-like cation transporter
MHFTSLGWCTISIVLGALNAIGQIMMRMDGGNHSARELLSFGGLILHSTWWSGLLLCWTCGLGYALIIGRLRLSVAMPLFFGVMYLSVTFGSIAILKEPSSWREAIASALILLGVLMLMRR